MGNTWEPNFFESLKIKDRHRTEAKIKHGIGTVPVGEFFRYARYVSASHWLMEREAQLGQRWDEMCAHVLPVLRRRPYTNYTLMAMSQYSHGMHLPSYGLVNNRPVTRGRSLPADWRLGYFLGKSQIADGGASVSMAAVVAFSSKTQRRQAEKMRHLNGITAEAARPKLRSFRKDLKPNKVRSIWVGQLDREASKSWKKGYVKARNPRCWPQELEDEAVFARLLGELSGDPTVSDNPCEYLEQQYGTQEAIDRQAYDIELLGQWALKDFAGYLSSEELPKIIPQLHMPGPVDGAAQNIPEIPEW